MVCDRVTGRVSHSAERGRKALEVGDTQQGKKRATSVHKQEETPSFTRQQNQSYRFNFSSESTLANVSIPPSHPSAMFIHESPPTWYAGTLTLSGQ